MISGRLRKMLGFRDKLAPSIRNWIFGPPSQPQGQFEHQVPVVPGYTVPSNLRKQWARNDHFYRVKRKYSITDVETEDPECFVVKDPQGTKKRFTDYLN